MSAPTIAHAETVKATSVDTREAWLHRAIEALRPRFEDAGLPVPEKLHVSPGFGGSAKAENKVILGVCWSRAASADRVNHIFLSPVMDDPARILDVLIHELVHAADNCQSGHTGTFATVAKKLGLTGKMTATVASEELAAEMRVLAASLGPYPHGRFVAFDRVPAPRPEEPGDEPEPPHIGGRPSSGPKTQTARQLKVVCPVDGYTARTTAKWLAIGYPSCPCGAEMVNG